MCNVGKIDKIIRALLGVVLLAAAFLMPQYWWVGIAGAIALGTALISFCPLYVILKLNTGCKKPDAE